jgi:hypothetical protein
VGCELLRLLFGRDRIRVTPDGLEVEQCCGLFRSREKVPPDEIRRFYRRPGGASLCVETARGTTELTRLGTVAERAELEQALNAEFQVSPQPDSQHALPTDWCELSSLECDPALVQEPAARRKQARVAWIVCGLVSVIAYFPVSAAQRQPALSGLALILVAFAALIGWGAVWLSIGRQEWRLENGRLVLQRRFGQKRTPQFEAVSLELVADNSGDSGPDYQLTVVAPGAPPRTVSHSIGKHRRVIYNQTDDPTEPRKFGRWLSHRFHIPFEDQTTEEAKAQQREELKRQLAGSGRIGRAALHFIERFSSNQRAPNAHAAVNAPQKTDAH